MARVSPASTKRPSTSDPVATRLQILRLWVEELRASFDPLPNGTIKYFFRFFFPQDDVHRQYNMQESLLAKTLCHVFGFDAKRSSRAQDLLKWDQPSDMRNSDGSGCLGDLVERVIEELSSVNRDSEGGPTFERVGMLLDELAATSPWSDTTIRRISRTKRTRQMILRELYTQCTPASARIITQIILKDMRPCLYPLPTNHKSAALLRYNSISAGMLNLVDVMKVWNRAMPTIYRARSLVGEASDVVQLLERENMSSRERCALFDPKLGIPVEVPKCVKAHKWESALERLKGAQAVWAETKYDGERMQIHIDLTAERKSQIQIFSKSKRDSTLDRIATHNIILEAIQNELHGDTAIRENAILEAEMVAFSEENQCIDEFWRIRELISGSAMGVRNRKVRKTKAPTTSRRDLNSDTCDDDSTPETQESEGNRHLAVVFFDILYHDGKSLLQCSYEKRRGVLEKVVVPRVGYSMLAERRHIKSIDDLYESVADHMANYQEGLVLKAGCALYNDRGWPWIKIKRDYIWGYGDNVDLVLFGAAWDRDRGRELRVAPGTWTSFYVAAIDDTVSSSKPHLAGVFVVSYGLGREELEEFNFKINFAESQEEENAKLEQIPYSFQLPIDLRHPEFILTKPLAVELVGAGFTKSGEHEYYELRFPRIQKSFRPEDRHWTEAMTFSVVQDIARQANGQEKPFKDVDDALKRDWHKVCSPRIRNQGQVERRRKQWRAILSPADRGQLPPNAMLQLLLRGDNSMVHCSKNAENVALRPLRALSFNADASNGDECGVSETRTRSDARRDENAAPQLVQPIALQSHFSKKSLKRASPLSVEFARTAKRRRTDRNSPVSPSAGKKIIRTGGEQACRKSDGVNKLSRFRVTKGERSFPRLIPKDLDASSPSRDYLGRHFFNPIINEYFDTPLVRILLEAQVWIDPRKVPLFARGRPPIHKIIPPGRLVAWIGAIFIALGWTKNDRISYTYSAQRGVIFSEPDQLPSLIVLLNRKVQEIKPGKCQKQIIVLPTTLLATPGLPLSAIKGAVLWVSPRQEQYVT